MCFQHQLHLFYSIAILAISLILYNTQGANGINGSNYSVYYNLDICIWIWHWIVRGEKLWLEGTISRTLYFHYILFEGNISIIRYQSNLPFKTQIISYTPPHTPHIHLTHFSILNVTQTVKTPDVVFPLFDKIAISDKNMLYITYHLGITH